MATANSGWLPFPSGEIPPIPLKASYLKLLNIEVLIESKPITIKTTTYIHGEPTILWEKEEVNNMIIQEDIQFAIISKLSYGC